MHARNRTWLLGSDPVERCRQRTLPVEGGDGSTLSLDFTTGVLDPRLTFTRASGGTYVGNDGFVYGVDFATSSSLAIGTGSKSVTLTATAGASRRYEIGQTVYIANGANNMSGAVTAYSPSTQVLTINATSTSGSGSFTSWIVGNASPRFDYDPITLQPRGLLIEGTTNNLARYSETLEDTGSFWGYNATTRTVESSDVNPTGGTGSISFAPTTDGGSRYAGIFLTGQTTASTYTYSVWLKGKGTTACIISIQSSAGGQNATMTILSQPAGANASITGNGTGFPRISNLSTTGWTKVQVVLSANLGGTGTLRVFMYPNETTTQTTTDSLFAWGAQLETGSGASSYIPTGASQGSRAYDHCYATGANFTSWFSTGAGTVIAVSDNTKVNTQNLTATISDGTLNNQVRMGRGLGGSSNEYLLTTVGGSGAFQGTADSGYNPPLNTVYKMAYAWDTNNFAVVVNGGSAVADTSGTLAGAGVLTQLVVGLDFVSSPLDIYSKNGHIRSLKYYPTRLTNAQLQALTT